MPCWLDRTSSLPEAPRTRSRLHPKGFERPYDDIIGLGAQRILWCLREHADEGFGAGSTHEHPTVAPKEFLGLSDGRLDIDRLHGGSLVRNTNVHELLGIEPHGRRKLREGLSLRTDDLHDAQARQIADGTDDAKIRLEVAMTVDSGIGVIRHAQAGYETARDVANGKGKLTTDSIKVPLWWEPADKVTFGPEI